MIIILFVITLCVRGIISEDVCFLDGDEELKIPLVDFSSISLVDDDNDDDEFGGGDSHGERIFIVASSRVKGRAGDGERLESGDCIAWSVSGRIIFSLFVLFGSFALFN